jgi:hypothetical protein
MIYGYARVSTDGQSEAAQVRQLRAAEAKKVFREVANGAKTDRPQLRRLLSEVAAGDVVMVHARPTGAIDARPVEQLAAIAKEKAGFRSLGETWAKTGTAHGHLMRSDSAACQVRA